MTPGPGSTSGPKLPQLLVSVLLLGIADSMIGPYLVLFGADEAHLSPLQVGVFMSVIAVSGLAISAWLGRRYDRSASRAPAFIALAAPAVGYLALTTTTSYALLLLIAAAFLGAGMAAFRSCSPWPVPISTGRPAVPPGGERPRCGRCGRWPGPSAP
jgi:MFS transporter, SET family, sugar efflux transporter